MKARDLTEEQITNLAGHLQKTYTVEGQLRRDRRRQHLAACGTSPATAGCATAAGLPVNGQRTRTNARTRKGPKKTVAGKKSVKGMK